jgi:hypothetical protein
MEQLTSLNPKIYVFNSPGCHGHYLTYLIDRFSKQSPEIKNLPFNELGNSHAEVKYSGFANFIHVTKKHKQNLIKQNIIKIIYSNDILYFERVAMNRAGDANHDLNELHQDISFMKDYNLEFYNKICSLYPTENNSIPKWVLRDAYKLGFLDWDRQGSVIKSKNDIAWVNENVAPENNVHFIHVNIFFNEESIRRCLIQLDELFGLDLDLENLSEVHKVFMQKNKILQSNKNTDMVLDAISKSENIDIPSLDILQEAYLYAELEKQNDFVVMPLTDHFFSTTKEITDYVNCYPQHYKAMNTNLPKFNNIDNPFFLHRQKNK